MKKKDENATIVVTGTTVSVYNSNRNSANTSGNLVLVGSTVTTGTLILQQYSGANKLAGIVGRENEIILKQIEDYLFRITNETATANEVSWNAEWYEHTDHN